MDLYQILWEGFLGEREDQVCFVTIGKGMWKSQSKNSVKCKQSPVQFTTTV